MTLKEAAQQLGVSENTLYKNFKRTQETLEKYGIVVTRWGRGKTADYQIEYEEMEEDE